MTISSRTPEGEPLECPICGLRSRLEVSFPNGDATCPACGHLVGWLRSRVDEWGYHDDRLAADALLTEAFGDSLDTVEVIMSLEEETGVQVAVADAERMQTVGDFLRYLRAIGYRN